MLDYLRIDMDPHKDKPYKSHQIEKLKCFLNPLPVVSAQSIEARCYVENEDVVGAAPTGDAPTTSELSTISSPTEVRLILKALRLVPTFNC